MTPCIYISSLRVNKLFVNSSKLNKRQKDKLTAEPKDRFSYNFLRGNKLIVTASTVKGNSLQIWTGREDSKRLWLPDFKTHEGGNVVSPKHRLPLPPEIFLVESSWNVMAHADAREGKWRRNWRMEWVASTLHTTSERGVSSITTADAHLSAARSRLTWRPRRFKWTRPFRRKTKSGFYACAITFQTQCTHFVLEAESTPGPESGREDYINEKLKWHHRDSNPRPSSL